MRWTLHPHCSTPLFVMCNLELTRLYRQLGSQRRLPPTNAASDVLPAARSIEQLASSPRAHPDSPIVPPDPIAQRSLLDAADTLSASLDPGSSADADRFPTGYDSPTFMESLRINTRLVQAATLSDLECILYEELPAIDACDLGCVNLSTSFYQTTRLWGEAEGQTHAAARDSGLADVRGEIQRLRAQVQSRPPCMHVPGYSISRVLTDKYCVQQLNPVLVLLRPHLLKMPARKIVQPYDLAISLWCIAKLQLEDEELFQKLTERTSSMVQRLKPTDMAMVMWACGKLRCGSTMLCSQLTVAAMSRVPDFKPCELSMFVWGMCYTGQQSPEILRGAAKRMLESPEEFSNEELVRLMWSFTRMRWKEARVNQVHVRIFSEITKPKRLQKFSPQDCANVLWSMAQMHVFAEPEDLDMLADVKCGQLHRFQERELANLVYGYGAQRHWHEGLMTAAAAEVLLRKDRFLDKELCMFLWAVGVLGVAPGGELFLASVCKELHTRAHKLRPLSISNAMKAFAKLQYLPPADTMDAFSEAAVASLDQFSMAELSNLLWAYAQLGWMDEELFEAAEEYTMDNMHMCTKHHVSSIANSFKASGYLCHRMVTVARNHGFYV